MVGIYLYGDQSQTGTEANECIPVYGYRSQGSQRVYTCMVVTTNHRGASGYIPVWIPITGEPAGIYLYYGYQSQGSQRGYSSLKGTFLDASVSVHY
eukprot:1181941-Prorocentrum_minimum.AAC.3